MNIFRLLSSHMTCKVNTPCFPPASRPLSRLPISPLPFLHVVGPGNLAENTGKPLSSSLAPSNARAPMPEKRRPRSSSSGYYRGSFTGIPCSTRQTKHAFQAVGMKMVEMSPWFSHQFNKMSSADTSVAASALPVFQALMYVIDSAHLTRNYRALVQG